MIAWCVYGKRMCCVEDEKTCWVFKSVCCGSERKDERKHEKGPGKQRRIWEEARREKKLSRGYSFYGQGINSDF